MSTENTILVRRSNLLVSPADAGAVADCWRHQADAVTLDLRGHAAQRSGIKAALAVAAKGGADVFVRVDPKALQADLDGSVWPGLTGILLPCVESAADITAAEAAVAALETARGIAPGTLQFIVMLESAKGVWAMRAIVRASPRITQLGLDEAALAANLGFTPDPALDPFDYARGRLAVEATAARVPAVGMAYPLSVAPKELPPAQLQELAAKAKNLGMKGVLCPYASWVAPVNAAFTPTPELVEWNRRVRVAFADGVAAGTAAVPLDGKMIDVPVDEWAIVVLAIAEACATRDAAKRDALARAG